jgi:hypothetical protein
MTALGVTPYTFELLGNDHKADFSDLLPAATRTIDDDLMVPSTSDEVLEFLSKDLSVQKLNSIHNQLWIAGHPTPPRHLSYQTALSRDIVLSEKMELHLLWKAKRIYIKPLPRYLLAVGFWDRYIHNGPSNDTQSFAQRAMIAACARGFLLSYCALVAYESDFNLAKDIGLLPCGIEWKQWKTWVAQVIYNCPYRSVNQRFWYGELRLSRLNIIYRCQSGFCLRGYTHVGAPSDYSEFLSENFSSLVVGLGFFVVVLTAMQVGLATQPLGQNAPFQTACWGFTVFSIVTSLAAFVTIFMTFLAVFTINWMHARRYERKRMVVMNVYRHGDQA